MTLAAAIRLKCVCMICHVVPDVGRYDLCRTCVASCAVDLEAYNYVKPNRLAFSPDEYKLCCQIYGITWRALVTKVSVWSVYQRSQP